MKIAAAVIALGIVILLLLSVFNAGRKAREAAKQHRAEAVPMRGMLSYKADAASLIECATGEMFVVKFKGDWLEVERAYVSMQLDGAPAYAEFRGRSEADSTDGRVRAGLVIEEITMLRPDTSCRP